MVELCTGLQEDEKDLKEFLDEHPEFKEENPLSLTKE